MWASTGKILKAPRDSLLHQQISKLGGPAVEALLAGSENVACDAPDRVLRPVTEEDRVLAGNVELVHLGIGQLHKLKLGSPSFFLCGGWADAVGTGGAATKTIAAIILHKGYLHIKYTVCLVWKLAILNRPSTKKTWVLGFWISEPHALSA
jgi:hypothetical protein